MVSSMAPRKCNTNFSLRSWRYCVGVRLKFWRRSRGPKKGSRDKAVFLAASPLVTAPPSNLTRLYYNGSAAKSHSTTTQYCQLRRLHEFQFSTLRPKKQDYLFKCSVNAPGNFPLERPKKSCYTYSQTPLILRH